MAALIDLRQRIKGVKSTQKITRAMKMVAAARLRKSQASILSARPYATRMLQMLNSVAQRVNHENHPLLRNTGDKNIELIILTGDKGLCGSFNTNIIKQSEDFLESREDKELFLNLVGKKGRDYFKKRKFKIRHEYIDIFRTLSYDDATLIADQLIEEFTRKNHSDEFDLHEDPSSNPENAEEAVSVDEAENKEKEEPLDAIYIVYNEFKSVLQQRVVVERLLPIGELDFDESAETIDYIYEPEEEAILEKLLPLHIRTQVWRALLESNAAEQAARMNAMENATNNAQEIIDNLTLTMNKLRQQTITTQLIEVVSGADALKG